MKKGIKIGDYAEFSKTLTQCDVYEFAGITGDFNPVHVNSVAAKNSIFHKQVCHGMLTASLFSTVIGTKLPGQGSVYLEQNSKFLKPVYFNDTVTARLTVIDIDKDHGIVNLETNAFNQDGILVVTGNAKVKI